MAEPTPLDQAFVVARSAADETEQMTFYQQLVATELFDPSALAGYPLLVFLLVAVIAETGVQDGLQNGRRGSGRLRADPLLKLGEMGHRVGDRAPGMRQDRERQGGAGDIEDAVASRSRRGQNGPGILRGQDPIRT